MITFGQVIAYVVNIIFSNVPHGWRHMFAFAAIPAVAQCLSKDNAKGGKVGCNR